MAAWIGEPYDYENRDDGLDVFSLWVIGFVFVALIVFGIWQS